MLLPAAEFKSEINALIASIPFHSWMWPVLTQRTTLELGLEEDSFISYNAKTKKPLCLITFWWDPTRDYVTGMAILAFQENTPDGETVVGTRDVLDAMGIQFSRGARYITWPSVEASAGDKIYRKMMARGLVFHLGQFPMQCRGYAGEYLTINTFAIFRNKWNEFRVKK